MGRLILGPDGPDQYRAAAFERDPLLQLLGVGADGQPVLSAGHDFGHAQARPEHGHALAVREQGIDVNFLDLGDVDEQFEPLG